MDTITSVGHGVTINNKKKGKIKARQTVAVRGKFETENWQRKKK